MTREVLRIPLDHLRDLHLQIIGRATLCRGGSTSRDIDKPHKETRERGARRVRIHDVPRHRGWNPSPANSTVERRAQARRPERVHKPVPEEVILRPKLKVFPPLLERVRDQRGDKPADLGLVGTDVSLVWAEW